MVIGISSRGCEHPSRSNSHAVADMQDQRQASVRTLMSQGKIAAGVRETPHRSQRRASPAMAIEAETVTSTRHASCTPSLRRRTPMLYTIAVILLVLWLLGLVSGYTVGAFIHILLVIAVVVLLVGLLSGRRVV
jgi:hypothetical protein